jgi:hypothetical protein
MVQLYKLDELLRAICFSIVFLLSQSMKNIFQLTDK